jgi:hypothetical protein
MRGSPKVPLARSAHAPIMLISSGVLRCDLHDKSPGRTGNAMPAYAAELDEGEIRQTI